MKNKTLSQIADELEENIITIEPIYKLIMENPDKTKEEIYNIPPITYVIKLQTAIVHFPQTVN